MAVKVEELRSGNWINSVNAGEAFALPTTELFYIADNPEGYEPIPLTEEWLVKFGWGKSDEHEFANNINPHFVFIFDTHFKRLRLEVDNNEASLDVPMPQIQHVHQLQNLYYALTGQELTA